MEMKNFKTSLLSIISLLLICSCETYYFSNNLIRKKTGVKDSLFRVKASFDLSDDL